MEKYYKYTYVIKKLPHYIPLGRVTLVDFEDRSIYTAERITRTKWARENNITKLDLTLINIEEVDNSSDKSIILYPPLWVDWRAEYSTFGMKL